MKLNLPELPEGYFWRVTDNKFLGPRPFVELRKKTRFGSGRVDSMWTDKEFPTMEAEVVYLACGIYDRWKAQNQEWLELRELQGDYHS